MQVQRIVPLLLLTTLALASPLAAQGSWAETFDAPGLLGRVFALGSYQGELVAGGLGVQGDGHTSFGLTARFDGTHWQPMGQGIHSGGSAEVRAFVEFGGQLIVGGEFCCSGIQSVQSIASWDGQQWSNLGGGIAGIVYALEVYDGELYAAGSFNSAGGVPVQNIARWDGIRWSDVGGGLKKSFDPEVLELQVGPDGLLYASGEFDMAGGASAFNVARWNGTTWSALGPGLPGGLNGYVWDLEWFQGDLYACGNMDLVAGGANQEKVAKWTGSTWVAVGNFPDSSIGTSVTCLSVLSNRLYAGGSIVQADNASATRIAAFDGSNWTSIGGVSGSGQTSSIWAQTVHNGALIVGGEFSVSGTSPGSAGPKVVCHSVSAFDGAQWHARGSGAGFNAAVKASALWNGRVVALGTFSEAGSRVVAGPVVLEGEDWVPLGQFSGHAKSLLVWGNDLIVGGDFTSIDGVPIQSVARYDGVQWSGFGGPVAADALEVYQGQLYAGGLGGVKRWNGAVWETYAAQLFGQVYDLHVHQGTLYTSGSMFGSGHLVAWDGTTQQTVGGGANGSVYCLESFEGKLVFGGVFTDVGGQPAFRLATWDGSQVVSFPGVTGTNVDSLAVFQGELYASGNLIVPGLPANKYIARWDGASWQALDGGFGSGGQASTLTADDQGGHLYAGGIISHAGDVPSWYFASWVTAPLEPGTPFCFGDPAGNGCPCGNVQLESGHGCTNSAWPLGAALSAIGALSAAVDELQLHVEWTVPQAVGLFFQGSQAANGGLGSFFGDGLLCVGGPVQRLRVVSADSSGLALSGPGLAALGGAVPGVPVHYQWWYRDPLVGPCGSGFNLSNGLTIQWQP